MLAKSVLVFYKNLMLALIKKVVSNQPIEVTIPTSKLDAQELDTLETSLTVAGWSIKERDRDYYLVIPEKVEVSEEQRIMSGTLCPYCKTATVFQGRSYECPSCGASVECHPGTLVAMGFVARGKLREKRNQVHKVLDELWRTGRLSRSEVYSKLREKMCLTKAACHVAKFNESQCDEALEYLKQITKELENARKKD
jgi:hypothetical protein